MHSISFENLSMLRHKARVVRWSRIHQPSQRSSTKTDKLCKVLRFLSKWHYCPSDIIVQVTLLSKWQYCPSEYCPSDIIVQVNIVQVTLLSKSMYITSRIVVEESISRKNFEDQQNLQKQRKSINCDKIFQFLSTFQSEQKCYTVISRLSKNELDRVAS